MRLNSDKMGENIGSLLNLSGDDWNFPMDCENGEMKKVVTNHFMKKKFLR